MDILQDKVINPLRTGFIRTARIMKPVMHFAGLFNEGIADISEIMDPALDIGLAISTGGISAADDYVVRTQPWMEKKRGWTDTRGTKWHFGYDANRTTPYQRPPQRPPRPRINPRTPKRGKFDRPNRPPNINTSNLTPMAGPSRPPLPPRQNSAPARRNSDPFGKRKAASVRRSSFAGKMNYREQTPFYDTTTSSDLPYTSASSYYSSNSSPGITKRFGDIRM